jgi:hypothetical protein
MFTTLMKRTKTSTDLFMLFIIFLCFNPNNDESEGRKTSKVSGRQARERKRKGETRMIDSVNKLL